MIKALWIDDQPNDAFCDNAYGKGIDIDVKCNVDDGIAALLDKTNSYDAIILDANCISHPNGQTEPDITALGYALRRISEERISLPWFVYSGGGFTGESSIDVLVRAHERIYDDKDWYKKPLEKDELFEKIKSVLNNWPSYRIKQKHKEIFEWYPYNTELVEILEYLEEDRFNNPDVFNKVRKVLDWIMQYLYEHGLLLEPFRGTNLGECSKFIGDNCFLGDEQRQIPNIIPLYIQRSFHSVCTLSNEGSHRLRTEALVREGKARYLVRSILFEFLNILYWVKDLPTMSDEIEDLRLRVANRYFTRNSLRI